MFDDLILHDTTRAQLSQFLANPSHALLVVGPEGIGKRTLAEHLMASLLTLQPSLLTTFPHYAHIRPEGTSISIDHIRQLRKFLQLKTTGEQTYRRAIIVESAHTMTIEAQNAFLKLLEEPPADTVITLTATSPRELLPTIRSRLQTITVYAPSRSQLEPLLASSQKDVATRQQAYFLSGGLPGLLSALLQEDKTHPLLESVASAKELLQKTTFERLALADSLSKQKEQALYLVQTLERIAQTGLQAAGAKQNQAQIKQWHRIRKAAHQANEALMHSANAKLTLTNLFLQL